MGSHEERPAGKFEVSNGMKTLYAALIFVGLAVLLIGLIRQPERVWPSYLTSLFFFTSITVGGIFFVAINVVTNAGWSVNIRRFAECFYAFTPFVAVGALLLYFGLETLYPWADAERVSHDYLLAGKVGYLNKPFFLIRTAIFGIGLWFFARVLVGNSLKQDQTGEASLTAKSIPWGIGFLFFFSLFYSLFSVDVLMALLPYWYSTIFGIYCFAAGFQATLALMILLVLSTMNRGILKGIVTIEHVHDLAKYLKGFTIFWAYIAFSQFLLIWYSNIPEETEFYHMRMHGEWTWISLGLIVFRFAVPFLALLPRWAKRTPGHLKMVCSLVLVMHYVDIFWIVYPNFNDHHLVFSFYEIGVFALFAGLFIYAVTSFLSKNSIVPTKDPRRMESYNHHVTY